MKLEHYNPPKSYLPDPGPNEDTCPGCGKSEHIVHICKNCGHVYEDEEAFEDVDTRVYWYDIVKLALVMWGLWTLVIWIAINTRDNPMSLLEVIIMQYNFLFSLKLI